MTGGRTFRGTAILAALTATMPLALVASPAWAQTTTLDGARLSDALRTLARNPQSFDALVAAGEASLRVDDVDAALGFFRRAQVIQPQDARTKAGIAAVMVRQRQPLEALRLFAEAEQGGGLNLAHIGDRGLAYDLIGDNARAQQDYQVALAAGADPVVTRRLALSLAIAGNQTSSEAILLPLLQKQDLAAYRTRAFMLAIVGKGEEAVSIAQTMLPATLSGRMAPYLRYMPRLTRAQQAAAANLGAFPPAGDIGRDDPALAAYAASIGLGTPRTADSRLVPSGAPLGAPATSPQPAPIRTAAARTAPAPSPTPAPSRAARRGAVPVGRIALPTPTPSPAVTPVSSLPPTVLAGATRPAAAVPVPSPVTVAPAQVAAAGGELPALRAMQASQGPPAGTTLASPQGPVEVAAVSPPQASSFASASPAPPAASFTAAATPAPATVDTSSQQQPVIVARLEDAQPATPPALVAPPQAAPAAAVPSASAPPPARAQSLSEAFADLGAAVAPDIALNPPTAVDITRVQPRRQVAVPAKPAAPPKPPPVPSRQWVQVATGRDLKALAFDWRRIKREAGGLLDKQTPSTADWGQTNRLVVGPFATTAAADQMIGKLKDKKIDAFRFTSATGEAVTALP